MKIVQPKSLQNIVRTVKEYVDFIAPTYGPAGKKILIALSPFNIKAVDDGHEAAKEYELENEFSNSVISYIREATEKTNSRVGDGTTTAAILTGAIVAEATKDIDDPLVKMTVHGKIKEIEKGTREAIDKIREKSKTIKTKQELYKVAYNSYNNDEVATLISDTLFKIGQDGLLSIEDSHSVQTEVEMIEGLELDKGIMSPYLVNTDKDEGVLINPQVLVINKKIDTFLEIAPVLKNIIESGKKDICIVADTVSEDVLRSCIMNKIKGSFSPLIIEAPGFGDAKLDSLKNIAAVTGATVIDPSILKIEDIKPEHIGIAKKVICKKDKTLIFGGSQASIDKRVKELEKELKHTVIQFQKEKIEKLIAALKGGIALIKVGAKTENEQKAIKAKVEDAVNATKIAFKDGIVKGAGLTYSELKTSSPLLNAALKAPRKQLEENGKEYLQDNVTDPAGVLIAALETASSIACGLLSISGIITMKRKKEDKEIFDY
jgi:chaperonin GroEL